MGCVWRNDAEAFESEVGHRSCYRSDVERIAWRHEDHFNALALCRRQQGFIVEPGMNRNGTLLIHCTHVWSPVSKIFKMRLKRCAPRRGGAMRGAGFRPLAAISVCVTARTF